MQTEFLADEKFQRSIGRFKLKPLRLKGLDPLENAENSRIIFGEG